MEEYYNLAFERSVLSSFLFEPKLLDEYKDIIKNIDFYLPAHQDIYEIMSLLCDNGKPIDEEFIKRELQRLNRFDEMAMLEVISATPISDIDSYIEAIKDNSSHRKLTQVANQIKASISVDEKLDILKQNIDSIENNFNEVEEISGSDLMLCEFENRVTYETGIEAIAKIIGGLEKSQLIYVTGAEETGKTHLTYKIMENLSVGFKVGIVSLEFGKRKFKERLQGMIKRGHKLEPKNIKASFESHSINKIEKLIKKWASEGVGFIVLDSFNLVENTKNKDNNQNVIDTGRRLFKLTQQLDILLLVISTSTKADHKEGNPSIYGGQLLNHYCDQKWHIMRDLENEDRLLWVNKNKQNYQYGKETLFFAKDGSIRSYKVEENEYKPEQHSNSIKMA